MVRAQLQIQIFPRKYGFFPYIWLIYLILPLINLNGQSGFKLILGYVMVALFAVTYRQLYWVSGRAFSYWLGLQMLLIAVLCIFYSPYNLYMGFFTTNFIGWYTDHKRFNRAYAGFAILLVSLVVWVILDLQGTEGLFLLPFTLIMLVLPFGMRSLNRRQYLEKELDQANEVIKELVKREERMRIARDLHDTLGHTLSLITLKSQLVEKLVTKDAARAQAEAREIQRTSRAALRQVRELVSEMRAISVVEELAEVGEMLRTADITLEVGGDFSLEGVSDLTQNILSLCIKEAVTNIVKHSEASICRIGIGKTLGEVQITIEDNGIGLHCPEGGTRGHQEGNGMKGMAERLSLIDGSLSLNSEEGGGTKLVVVVPMVVKERKGGEAT
ncbi:sensor histidine kinase [Paenibacillus sp. 19GGS1-52]|uniref:sensor histidine kinase n=1 Tax=Paenibacillus sp. 19GGS1-52 TaxID=2758563 RepID=UPI001EFAD629|nr:sensor histidine kinase [Paenibacillus sp. 19GGS1-52]ULO07242.1 sensor histidine kinase [Paenibacillus sp. 19GGS1-52]